MSYKYFLILLLIIIIFIIIIYMNKNQSCKSFSKSKCYWDKKPYCKSFLKSNINESYCDKKSEEQKYIKIMDVSNVKDMQKYFLWDNPLINGSDPTGGNVDYSYPIQKDLNNKLIPNINNDVTWSEIGTNKESQELLSNYSDGIKLNLAQKIINGNVGAPRITSRKLFKGGLFIFDVEHVPIGCGVWPALWLNGFVGLPDQYHQNESNSSFSDNMEKLVKSTLGTKESYNHTCSNLVNPNTNKIDDNITGRKDDIMSKFTKADVYPMEWPGGGELDILEQTNFSQTNLISVHNGPHCEVTTSENDNIFAFNWLNDNYKNNQLRSTCNQNTCNSQKPPESVFGTNNRTDCPIESINNAGNDQIIVPNGFGENFNENGGGTYVVQWIPKEKIYIWFYPRNMFDNNYLKKNNYPLSDNPNPDLWPSQEFDIKSKKYYNTLVASYILNDEVADTASCDMNFQAIIINITLGG